MTPLSVEQQDQRIRVLYPQFRLVFDNGWIGIWEGPLTPISQTYRIRIRYISRRYFDEFRVLNPYETVTVIDPSVAPDPRGTGEATPHVYSRGYPARFPRLCIHDPEQDEWSPDEHIAEKIIPFTIKWLLFYEDWLLDGVWRGGGRHPEAPVVPCVSRIVADPESRARRDQFRRAEFHRLGQKTGVFASCLSMAVASAAFFPRRSWRDLSAATPLDVRLHVTSILSPEHPRVESSRWASAPASPPASSLTSISGAEEKFFLHSPTLPWAV